MKKEVGDSVRRKRSVARYLLYLALFLLSFVIFNLLIATFLFIFRVSIQWWYVILAGVLSIVMMMLVLYKKQSLEWKSVLTIIVLPLVAIAGLTVLNGKIYDYTYDGNDYHKLAIGLMMEGWNPLHESEAEFIDARMEKPIDLDGATFWWGDAYAKASYIFAANVGSLTKNVESGKILNDISIVIVFCMFLGILLYVGKSWWFALVFAGIAVTPTTISAQFLTNYVDILVYLYMFLLLSLFFWFEYTKEYHKELLLIFFATLVMLINIKFTAFAYAGILCAFYYGWYIYRYKKDKDFDKKFFKKFTWFAAAAVFVGVFLVGLSTYPRNTIVYGHPLFPLMGEGKEDIMTKNSPAYFKDKSNLERFLIATFSKMDNIGEASGKEAEWKIPFSVHESELQYYGYSDLRISGNGIFFSGVLIVSLLVVLLGVKGLYRQDKKLCIMLMLPVIMTLIMIVFMPESWWARYFPQLFFVVFAALIILETRSNIVSKVVLCVMSGLILINNVPYMIEAVRSSYSFTRATQQTIHWFVNFYVADECKTLVLKTEKFPGAYFSGREKLQMYQNIEYVMDRDGDLSEYVPLMNPYLLGKCEDK